MNFQFISIFMLQVSQMGHDFYNWVLKPKFDIDSDQWNPLLFYFTYSIQTLQIVIYLTIIKNNKYIYLSYAIGCCFIGYRVYFYGSAQLWSSFQLLNSNFKRNNHLQLVCYILSLLTFVLVYSLQYDGFLKLSMASEIFQCLSYMIYIIYTKKDNKQNLKMVQGLLLNEIQKNCFLKIFDKNRQLIFTYPTTGETQKLSFENNYKVYMDQELSSSPSNQKSFNRTKTFHTTEDFITYLETEDNLDSLHFNWYLATITDQQTKIKTKYRVTQQKTNDDLIVLYFMRIDPTISKKSNVKFMHLKKDISNIFTHKLKTPLNAVLGHLTQAYYDQDVDMKIQNNYIKPAYVNSKLQLFQIQDLLEYLNSDQEASSLQICKINLKTLFISLQELIQTQCSMKNIHLLFTINDIKYNKMDKICIYSDVLKLERALFNLLNLSYRNTTQNGIISLNVTIDKDAEDASFQISDMGMELSQEEIDDINQSIVCYNLFKVSKKKSHYQQEMLTTLSLTSKLIKSLNQFNNQSLELCQTENSGIVYKFKININRERSADSSLEQYKIGYILKQRSCRLLHTHHNISQKSIFSGQDLSIPILEDSIDEPSANTPIIVKMSLPSKRSQQQQRQISDQPQQLSQTQIDQTKSILIVDDEPFNHDTLILMLKSLGFQSFFKAFDGQQAINIAIAKQNEIHVVFMDLDMPIMGGIEATKFLVEEMMKLNMPYFPIIGCTAHGDADSIEQCIQAGMLHVVVKPVFIKNLKETFNLISDHPQQTYNRIGSLQF
ncbi:unnamed protein product (macronuclear) [Paramecium tetraurelia]|uniref:Response regulatory domain-containing protein n=1 Tax=Paramecium tetraurelia TaxID=5888 RepID=A0DM01_PARTE|nr:uncharacterized protein GSPATT00018286001 [Paramecium tetraurelia]CAK84068.1 unnamed protein product [Paramecium tetraurelia]|eukprot:XP_001451465.1 hypothetical protein (macronuclear) [Paramecium tetraurelia strain d4-2]